LAREFRHGNIARYAYAFDTCHRLCSNIFLEYIGEWLPWCSYHPVTQTDILYNLKVTGMRLCKFFVRNFCDIRLCTRVQWPKELIYGRCPLFKTRYLYQKPAFKDFDRCVCYLQSCDNCGTVLCSCTVRSIWGICPSCGVYDKWIIIPSELVSSW
jgi:hypothetical protein